MRFDQEKKAYKKNNGSITCVALARSDVER